MTEEQEVPDHRCGFELKPADTDVSEKILEDLPEELIEYHDGFPEQTLEQWHEQIEAVCCWRKTWQDTDRCVWHAEVENKPIEELKAARVDGPERLDGAYLADVEAGDDLSFRKCVLRSAVFSNGEFSKAQFHDAFIAYAEFQGADFSYAEFHNASLSYTEFHNTRVSEAEFHDAKLLSAEFHHAPSFGAQFYDAFLADAEFYDADLRFAEFNNAYLVNTEFHDAILLRAKFHGADFSGDASIHHGNVPDLSIEIPNLSVDDVADGAKFHDADLVRAEFHDADLIGAQFYDADLIGTDYTDADTRYTDFTHATLHESIFTRADCRGATFTSALLYETVFADTSINSQTTFHDPEATFYDSIISRPAVVYEENPHTSDDLPKNIHPLEAAEWVYRRLEKLHDENALSEDARDFHISKEEARRKYQWESGEYARYLVSTLQWHVSGHGESIIRIFRSAAVLILGCGILYPFAGGFESSSTGAVYRFHFPPTEFSRAAILDGIATFLQSIYFSVITFTTIGYGDLYPTGAWSKVLVGFESLSGAILIALFVFVLGRRVAR